MRVWGAIVSSDKLYQIVNVIHARRVKTKYAISSKDLHSKEYRVSLISGN